MGMSIRTKNILTALLAVVLVGGFIFLAEGLKSDKKDDRLAAIEDVTTTTFRRTTTTRPVTTTTASTISATTTSLAAPVATTTTVKKTTTTRATTATSKKPSTTTTTPAPPHTGPGEETSDNTGTFTRSSTGAYSGNKVPACAATDPFCVALGAEQGENGQVRLVVQLRNNTNRTVSFPGGLRISVYVRQPSGAERQFILDASGVQSLAPAGEPHGDDAVRVSSLTSFDEVGDFQFTASVRVDYGS